MDEKTALKVIEYYNMGYTCEEISLKDDIFYSDNVIKRIIRNNKNKITFITIRDIINILNISYVSAKFLLKNSKIKPIRKPNKLNKKIEYRILKKDFSEFLMNNEKWMKYDYNIELISNYINLKERLSVEFKIEKYNNLYKRNDIANALRMSGNFMHRKGLKNLGKRIIANKHCVERYGDNAYKEKYLTKDEVKQFIKIGRYKHRNKALLKWLEKN